MADNNNLINCDLIIILISILIVSGPFMSHSRNDQETDIGLFTSSWLCDLTNYYYY